MSTLYFVSYILTELLSNWKTHVLGENLKYEIDKEEPFKIHNSYG